MAFSQGIACVLLFNIFLPIHSTDINQVPYISPMLLGRTFDLSTSEIGNDIFTNVERAKFTTIRQDKTTIQFRMVKDSSQIEDMLSVSGQLALQIKGGLVNIEGSGSYLKESSEKKDFVEVLARVQTTTVTETLTNNLSPVTGFSNDKLIGKHYIRSMTHGGLLLASLRFTVKKDVKKEDIEAKVKGSVNTMSVNVGLEGQFKKVANEIKDLSDLSIRYYSTAPLNTVPIDVDTLLAATKEFPVQLRSVNNGKGIPIFVNVQELSTLDNINSNLTYIDNRLLRATIDDLYDLYTDLLQTDEEVKYWLKNTGKTSNNKLESIKQFYKRLSKIIGSFDSAIAAIDLNCGTDSKPCSSVQFDNAFNSYKGEGNIIPGKYLREFNRLKWELELTPRLERQISRMIEEKTSQTKDEVDRLDLQFKRIVSDPTTFLNKVDNTIRKLSKILPGKLLLAYQIADINMYAGDRILFETVEESSLKGFVSSSGVLKIQTSGLYLISYAVRIIKNDRSERRNARVDFMVKKSSRWESISYTAITFPEGCHSCDTMLSNTIVFKLEKGASMCLELDSSSGTVISNINNFLSVLLLRDISE